MSISYNYRNEFLSSLWLASFNNIEMHLTRLHTNFDFALDKQAHDGVLPFVMLHKLAQGRKEALGP
jgi:hypothetical protein